MSNEPQARFLSEKSILLHKEFLETQRRRYSIFEKSFPNIVGRSIFEIYSMRSLKYRDKEDMLELIASVRMHELYFSSFASEPTSAEWIKEYYSSCDAFLYEALLLGRDSDNGFLVFYLDCRGKPRVAYTKHGVDILLRVTPILVLDICEHSYFLDYGFDRGEYLRRALGFLDISRLNHKS